MFDRKAFGRKPPREKGPVPFDARKVHGPGRPCKPHAPGRADSHRPPEPKGMLPILPPPPPPIPVPPCFRPHKPLPLFRPHHRRPRFPKMF